ncbi:MAG: glycosyltransferase family 2 protein [Acidobacteria bacterium]|nr:glycosyltransferase family 2 protein [Acidobacteriota bacterium]
MHDVSVIIVGLNSCRYVREALESLQAAEWRSYSHEVIYVDNGSTDDTLAVLEERFPEVRVLANDSNLGFCRAANQGARIARCRHYFFLNDDTIVLKDAIPLLIDFLDRHPGIGVVGSRLLNTDYTDQWSGRKFPSPLNAIFGRRSVLSRWLPGAKPLTDYLCREQVLKGVPFAADWVSAAALLAEATVFREVGGFAEDYYYWHEAVFCDRIRHAGKEIYLHPQSKIIHYEGKGSGERPYDVKKRHIIDFHRGAYRCYCEHYRLRMFHPIRALVGTALFFRAIALLAFNRVAGFSR